MFDALNMVHRGCTVLRLVPFLRYGVFRAINKWNFAQVDFCPSAPIAQVPLLPKCLYCPSNLIAQVLFSCIIAQVDTNWNKISLKEQQNISSLNKSIKIKRKCKVI